MRDFLVTIGGLLAFISAIAFFVGIILLFFESKKKIGLKIVLCSLIGFVIGFSTCAVNLNLNLH